MLTDVEGEMNVLDSTLRSNVSLCVHADILVSPSSACAKQ